MSFDAFLVFSDTIKGETTDSQFNSQGGIDIYSFSWGLSNPSSVGVGSGLGAGKVSISSLNVHKRVDSASTDLALCCASGKHLSTATLYVRKAGGDSKVTYLQVTLTDVLVDAVQISGAAGGEDYPTESVSLAFGKIQVQYTPQTEQGAAGTPKEFGWNLEGNVKM